jgi:anhydro-N-acetylmuramic acid kinase
MNKNIKRLIKIAAKRSRYIIGLMSGTSMDGLDVALCKISKHGLKTKIKLLQFETVPYTSEVKAVISEVFAKQTVDFEKLCTLNPRIGILHGNMVLSCLEKWKLYPEKIDVIASHGQTVFHAPAFLQKEKQINATLQIGDGDHVAVTSGIVTISDFRQKHVAGGGEGAPLAVYGDFLLLSHKLKNRILLNIGGIANFTFLPKGKDPGKVFVTDTGPGNTLLDQVVRKYFPGEYYDKDAQHGLAGTVNSGLLKKLKADSFFKMPFPKTTGPELFNLSYLEKAQQLSQTQSIPVNDLIATLTRFSAETIAEAIHQAPKISKMDIYLSGGGAHNPLLVRWLSELLQIKKIRSTTELGINGDAKEAVLFAILANEALMGGKVNFGERAKIPSVSMGKISFPE